MIVLYTDFGVNDHYVGQLKAVLARRAPHTPVVDLFHEVPVFDIQAAAYLLPALTTCFPINSIFCCVVDPGVGGKRRACIVQADGLWFVGPDNGLFNVIAQRARRMRWWELLWRPVSSSNTFHGRDIFAPVAAALASGCMPEVKEVNPRDQVDMHWPSELAKVVYIDHYGNIITGIRACNFAETGSITLASRTIGRAETFSDVEIGTAFWYENSNGLVEIAVNQGNAATLLNVQTGDHFDL